MKKRVSGIIVVLSFVFCVGASLATPTLEIDSYTLDKLIGGNNHLFVQFVERPWGKIKDWDDGYNEWKAVPGVIVATITAKDEENHGLAERFGITQYPTFIFFPKGESSKYELYAQPEDAEEAFEFLKTKLSPELDQLHEIATQFLKSDSRKELLTKAEAIAAKVVEENFKNTADLYVKLLQKVDEKGTEFVSKELDRLHGLLSNAKIVEKQKRDFRKRSGILKAFQDAHKMIHS